MSELVGTPKDRFYHDTVQDGMHVRKNNQYCIDFSIIAYAEKGAAS